MDGRNPLLLSPTSGDEIPYYQFVADLLPPETCGDGTCDTASGETCENCRTDCVTISPITFCGNLVCEAGEVRMGEGGATP